MHPKRNGRWLILAWLRIALRAAMVASTVPCVLAGLHASEWPQWRGPGGEGHAPDAHDLPVRWSEKENVAWKTPLPGRGWSSPVIDGSHLWLTTAIETDASAEEKARRLAANTGNQPLVISGPVTFRAVAINRETGRIDRDVELFTVPEPQPVHKLNSFASPSPVIGDGRLYCHFGDYGTACVDVTSGRVAWINHDLRLSHENGPGSTPVLWRNLLVVHCDGSDVQFIAALDSTTGDIAWKTTRSGELKADPQLKKAYGTPLVVPIGGREVLVSPAADWLYGYDPATGHELWKVSYGVLGFSIVPRPVVAHGMLYMSTSFMQPEMLAFRLAEEGPPQIVWREKKGAPSQPSPLVVGDELYVVSDRGVGACLDARSGEVLWSERLGGNFSSSPMFADGRIYVGNREGHTFVLEPGRSYSVLAENELDGEIMATPVAIGRAIYLRTDKALYRLEKPPAISAVTGARRESSR